MTGRRRVLIVAGSLLLATLAGWWLLPKPELYPGNGFSAALYSSDGELLRLSLAPDERYRLQLPVERIAPTMVRATLLYEDRHFFLHPGFDPLALLRAAWTTYVGGERAVGGSTITMQLARLRFGLETRSIAGKVWQIFRAVQLERHYSKSEILAAYFTLAPYGGNIESVGAASLIYFRKPAAELTLAEAIALAVIPQNPVSRNPLRADDSTDWQAARQRLQESWLAELPAGYEQRELLSLQLQFFSPSDLPFRAPHFARDLIRSKQLSGEVISTLDAGVQAMAEDILQRHLRTMQRFGVHNAAAVILDRRDMSVVAYLGSANFSDDAIQGQVNGVLAQRSPGSALKPFIYGLAFDQGLIHPASILKDAPKRYGIYTPENFDRGFAGPVSATDALINSRNVPAVNLLARLQPPDLYQRLQEAGVENLASREHYGLALALGGIEISPLELAGLYASLANNGEWRAVRELQHAPSSAERRIMSPEAAYLVLDILKRTERPGALALAAASEFPAVPWKTGTSYAFRDAWTAGVVGNHVIVVWLGNFDGSGNPSLIGRQAAAPLFFQLADALQRRADYRALPSHPSSDINLRQVDICLPSGSLPDKYCPHTGSSWFIPGVSPISMANVFRPIAIDTVSGKRACWHDANVRIDVYQVWPSDLAAVFRQAGIAFAPPPQWHPRCGLNERASQGAAPRITSPDTGIEYLVRPEQLADEKLAFRAIADGEAKRLYWFVDDSFIGSSGPNEIFYWPPRTGRFRIRVVDDLGNSNQQQLTVSLAQ